MFLYLFFLFSFSQVLAIQHILLDINETEYNTRILDSVISSSNLTLYISTFCCGIQTMDISSIEHPWNSSSVTSSISVNGSLLAFLDSQQLWILDDLSDNQALYFFNASTNEQNPNLITSVFILPVINRTINANSWQLKKNSINSNYLYILEQNENLIILEVFDNFSVIFRSETPVTNCKNLMLANQDGYLFYHTIDSLFLINATEITNVSQTQIPTESLFSSTSTIQFNQFALSPDGSTLYLLYCPYYYDPSFYNWNISDITNITYLGNILTTIDCDTGRDELLLILPQQNYALITDYLGTTFLLYPSFDFLSRNKLWCNKILPLPNNYFIAIDSINGLVITFLAMDLDLDVIPYNLVDVENDLPTLFDGWPGWRTHFLFPISQNTIITNLEGYPILCDISDRANLKPGPSIGPNYMYTPGGESTIFSDPSSPFLVYYGKSFLNHNDPYMIIIFNKTDFTIYGQVSNVQPSNNITQSLSFGQIGEIVYMISMAFQGPSTLDSIYEFNHGRRKYN